MATGYCVMTDREACKQLLAQLHRGGPVAARELKRALGEEHWEEYERRREWVVTLREKKAKIASYKLRNYVNMLRIADLRDAQADRMRVRKGKSMPRGKRPSDLYERALEHLSERIEENGSLCQYLDRPFTPYVWTALQISARRKSACRVCGIRKTRCSRARTGRSRRLGNSERKRCDEPSKRCQPAGGFEEAQSNTPLPS
jgi:hypothetical protein